MLGGMIDSETPFGRDRHSALCQILRILRNPNSAALLPLSNAHHSLDVLCSYRIIPNSVAYDCICCMRRVTCHLNGKSEEIIHFTVLTTDLAEVPLSSFKKNRGKDGKMYYHLDYAIEMTCYSAHTTYAVICGGIRYDTVTAEYV